MKQNIRKESPSTTLNIILSIILSSISYHLNGQTTNPSRPETELWLLKKMNKYVAKNSIECHKIFLGSETSPNNIVTDCLVYSEVVFSFSRDNLIIDAKVTKTEYHDNGNVESKFKEQIRIPLIELSYDFFLTTNYLSFATKYAAIIIDKSNGESEKTSFFKLSFQTDEEDNFIVRFNKAMNYLRTFLMKPKSNETF